MSGKPPVLDDSRPSPRTSKPAGAPPARTRPAVKLAPMPTAEPPRTGKGKSGDPPVLKPDMKLPADALRASKSGSKPLAAHLRRHEDALETARKGGKDKAPPVVESEAAKAARGRRGAKAKTEEDAPLLGGREERQLARRRTTPPRGDDDQPVRQVRRINRTKRKSGISTAAPRKEQISIQLPCSVRELSEAAGVPGAEILRILMNQGVMSTLNMQMDPEMTELVAGELLATLFELAHLCRDLAREL